MRPAILCNSLPFAHAPLCTCYYYESKYIYIHLCLTKNSHTMNILKTPPVPASIQSQCRSHQTCISVATSFPRPHLSPDHHCSSSDPASVMKAQRETANLLTFFLTYLLTFFLTYLLKFFLIYLLTFFLTYLLTFFLTYLLTCFLTSF